MTTSPNTDFFRAEIDRIVDGDLLLDLARVARLLGLAGRNAVRYRILRGTLPVRTVQLGGSTTPLLVPTPDLYAVLGLEWTPAQDTDDLLVRVRADGSSELISTQ